MNRLGEGSGAAQRVLGSGGRRAHEGPRATLHLPEPWRLEMLLGPCVSSSGLLHHTEDAELHTTRVRGCAHTCTHHTHAHLGHMQARTHMHTPVRVYTRHARTTMHTHAHITDMYAHTRTCTHVHIPQDKASSEVAVCFLHREPWLSSKPLVFRDLQTQPGRWS